MSLSHRSPIPVFLAPTGAPDVKILYVCPCVCDIMQKNIEKEFLKHSKESRGVLGQGAQERAQEKELKRRSSREGAQEK